MVKDLNKIKKNFLKKIKIKLVICKIILIIQYLPEKECL